MLPLIRPDVTFGDVEEDLRAVFASGQLTSGPFVEQFERTLADVVGTAHAVATTSATAALHLALVGLGISPGDEVLLSDFTFPATGNVVVQLGATPVLVDSCPDSFALDPADAERRITERTRAIIPVDPFGQPADGQALGQLAVHHGLALVEDAACGLGAAGPAGNCGQWADTACFSFHPRKVVTTGEGGAITTDDGELAARLRQLRSHGSEPAGNGLEFTLHGFNYRLSEPSAVIGLAQLRRVDEILADRRTTAERYDTLLDGTAGVELRRPPARERWSNQSYVVMLDECVDRDGVIAALRTAKIESTLGTYALHAQPAFACLGHRPGDLPNSWRAQRQSLTLPLVPRMGHADVERVAGELAVAIERNRRSHAA